MPSFATEAVFALDVPAVATFGLAVLVPFAVCAVAGAAVGRGLGRSFGGGAVSCVVCWATGGTTGGTTSSVGSGDLSARGKSSGRGQAFLSLDVARFVVRLWSEPVVPVSQAPTFAAL